jgi:hypothetical protein
LRKTPRSEKQENEDRDSSSPEDGEEEVCLDPFHATSHSSTGSLA